MRKIESRVAFASAEIAGTRATYQRATIGGRAITEARSAVRGQFDRRGSADGHRPFSASSPDNLGKQAETVVGAAGAMLT